MSTITYAYHKCVAVVLRTLFPLALGTGPAKQDEVVQIPGRDGNSIKVNVYHSQAAKPSPVLINFHGSGWTISMHGSDDEFVRRVAKETDCTVLDATYRLAPEYPYPAAVHDAEDVIKWVLARPEQFDLSRLSISGFSAGGTLALVASSQSFPKETFRHLITFYPPSDFETLPSMKVAPDSSGTPLPDWMATIFTDSYAPPGVDRKDPKVSPCFSPPEDFPNDVVMITCACDNLCPESEELAQKIAAVPEKHVVCRRMEKCNHAWDKSTKPGTEGEKAKNDAYDLAIETLRR